MVAANNKWLIFVVVAIGVFMSTLDSSMVNIALPTIMAEFHSPLHKTEWVVLIYLLTITATLLFWGHLSDQLGRRRIYAGGLFIFGAASLFCAYTQSLGGLVFFRFLQALGAAMIMATGPALIKESFPPAQLGRALGLIGVAVSLGLMTGPSLGGLLIQFLSWRAIFFVTVPLGLLFSLLACRVLPAAANAFRFDRVDWPGGLFWMILLTTLSLAISHLADPAWTRSTILLCLVGALVAMGLFIRQEMSTLYPLLPLALFKKRYFSMATIAAVLSFMMLFAAILLTPFYLDRIRELPPARIGLIMMAIPLAVLVVGPLAGWVSDHIGHRIPTSLGLLIACLGASLMGRLTAETPLWMVALDLAVLGCGQALFLSPNSAAILSRAHAEHNGISAAMLATARNLGMLLGIAQASLVFAVSFSHLTGGLDMKDFSRELTAPFMAGFSNAFDAALLTGLVGAVFAWLREPLRLPGRRAS